jgi:archaellum component FlaC
MAVKMNNPQNSQNGWNEYSKLVLKELETLGENIDSVRSEIQEVKQDITIMKSKEDKVSELKIWKGKVDDVVSPTMLANALKDLEELKVFKTKAITTFAVVQFLMALSMWIINIVK